MKEKTKKHFHYSRIIGAILILVLIIILIIFSANNISKNDNIENIANSR